MRSFLRGLAVAIVLVAVWWVLTELHLWSAYVLPTPAKVWSSAVRMTVSGELPQSALTSFGRVVVGFAIAFGLAFALAVVALVLPGPDAFISPVLGFLKNVPPLALIPLLILWFGIGETPKIIVIVLTAFFPMYMNISKGLRSCSPHLLDVGTSVQMSGPAKFFLIRLPHALPDVLVGMRISLGYAWRALVGAEMIAAASGLGYLIKDSQEMSRSDKVIVGIVAIGLVGVATERAFAHVVRRTVRWGIDDSWR